MAPGVDHTLCLHAHARGGADSSKLRRRPTCTGRLGGAAAAGRRRHFFLAEFMFADSGATMVGVTYTRCPHARARGWAARYRPTCSTCSGRLGGAAAAGRTMVRAAAAPEPG